MVSKKGEKWQLGIFVGHGWKKVEWVRRENSFALRCVVRQALFECWQGEKKTCKARKIMSKQVHMAILIIALAWASCSSSPSSKHQAQQQALRLSMVVRGMSARSRVVR